MLAKNKVKIRRNFDMAAGRSYEDAASIQFQSATKLCTKLLHYFPKLSAKSILDLGAGTGFVTEQLIKILPNSTYTLNDIAPLMLKQSKEKFRDNCENISFICGDMEQINFPFYDLVISNFALQWLSNLKNMLKKICNKSGIFAFTCLLQDSFQEFSDIFHGMSLVSPVHQYPPQEELEDYISSLRSKRTIFDVEEMSMIFPDILTALKYFKSLGANTSHHQYSVADLLNVARLNNNSVKVTYRVFFGLIENHQG